MTTESQVLAFRTGAFILALLLAVALQRLRPHARLRGSWTVNGGLWVVDGLVLGVICGACVATAAQWARSRGYGPLSPAVPEWLVIPVTVLALDGVSYLWHRANHTFVVLWRFHQVHHSDNLFTVSTGLRFHPGELVLSLPLRLAAVVALAPSIAAVIVFETLFTIANLIEHGDIALPARLESALGRALITPALHRRHHGNEHAQLGTNFGTVFSFWDRLLGTYGENASSVQVSTGLPGLPAGPGLRGALALPFARLRVRP